MLKLITQTNMGHNDVLIGDSTVVSLWSLQILWDQTCSKCKHNLRTGTETWKTRNSTNKKDRFYKIYVHNINKMYW